VDGAGIQRITNTDFAEFDPAWSPLGDKIVYSAEFAGDGTTELFFLSVTAAGEPVGSAMQATDAASSSYSPAWSPDGSTVVFASDRRGDGDIYTMDAAGANEQLVTIDDGGAEDQSPSYSADGRWIVFISNREDASFQTYVMRDTGAEMRRITSSFRIDQSAVFRPRSLDPN
jgi:Tol biopolymer transport system component